MSAQNEATPDWPAAGQVSEDLSSAFQQTHSAVQWIARIVNSYAIPSSDGSHLHLRWNADDGAFESTTVLERFTVELRLPKFVLQFKENGKRTKHEVELDDKSPARIEAWTLIELLHRNIDRDVYTKTLPYDVAGLMSGDAEDYRTLGLEKGFEEMTAWISSSARMLAAAADAVVAAGEGTCDGVFLAPETFSLFARVHPKTDRPAIGSFVEIGLCADARSDGGVHFYAQSSRGDPRAELPLADARQAEDVVKGLDLETRLQRLSSS